MKRNRVRVCVVLVCSLLFQNCQKEDISHNTHSIQQKDSEGKIKLGEKLINPYSLENMKKAYESLQNQGQLKSCAVDEEVIQPTHYYVRFLPKDSLELQALLSDSLELFDYPLDYAIEQEGYYYHDSSIPEDEMTWQYTAVGVNYEFPNVKYEIIEPCFIPNDSLETELKSKTEIDFLGMLEYESNRLTNNLDEESEQVDESGNLKRWRVPSKKEPHGTIQVDNTIQGLEGVKRVKVRAHRYVKIKSTYTNESGDYHIDMGFRYDVHYSLIFENSTGFKIWGNWAMFSPAHYNMGKHSKSGYSKNIHTNSKAWLWSTVNNGIYYYREYLCPKYGVSKPISDLRIWTLRTGGKWGGCAPMARHISLGIKNLIDFLAISYAAIRTQGLTAALSACLPDIFLFQDYTSTRRCYATLWHELSHASHYTKVGKQYWTRYIAAISRNRGYGNGTGSLDGYIGVGEMWGNYFGNYVCCNDYFGYSHGWRHNELWYNPGFLVHSISYTNDITTNKIYSCLKKSVIDIDKLKNELKTKTSYDSQIDNAYDNYSDWP
ncbi:MAG: hypothetical protein ACOCWB_02555 [Bacteroidota bacterium]